MISVILSNAKNLPFRILKILRPAGLRMTLQFILFTCLFFNYACFFGGGKHSGRVKGYSHGVVITQVGRYKVGPLGKAWTRKHYIGGAITFYNRETHASISTQSYCDQATADIGLEFLIKDFFYGLTNLKTLYRHEFILDGREALRLRYSGKLDGMPALVDAVSVKKNQCLIDFYLVSSPEAYSQNVASFEDFFKGFTLLEKRE